MVRARVVHRKVLLARSLLRYSKSRAFDAILNFHRCAAGRGRQRCAETKLAADARRTPLMLPSNADLGPPSCFCTDGKMGPESGIWWQQKEVWINDEGSRHVWEEESLLHYLYLRIISSISANSHRRGRTLWQKAVS